MLFAFNFRLFKSNGRGRKFGEKCKSGDRVGCGIKFEQVFETGRPDRWCPSSSRGTEKRSVRTQKYLEFMPSMIKNIKSD